MDPIRMGSELESLRNNDYFMKAVEEMKQSLVEQEDSFVRDTNLSEEQLFNSMKRISMMRVLLTDLVETLDSYILRANNAQYEKEQGME